MIKFQAISTAEEILIRSGNIGTVRIAQKIGIEKYKVFLENLGLLNKKLNLILRKLGHH